MCRACVAAVGASTVHGTRAPCAAVGRTERVWSANERTNERNSFALLFEQTERSAHVQQCVDLGRVLPPAARARSARKQTNKQTGARKAHDVRRSDCRRPHARPPARTRLSSAEPRASRARTMPSTTAVRPSAAQPTDHARAAVRLYIVPRGPRVRACVRACVRAHDVCIVCARTRARACVRLSLGCVRARARARAAPTRAGSVPTRRQAGGGGKRKGLRSRCAAGGARGSAARRADRRRGARAAHAPSTSARPHLRHQSPRAALAHRRLPGRRAHWMRGARGVCARSLRRA
jgi:hypothetical protein